MAIKKPLPLIKKPLASRIAPPTSTLKKRPTTRVEEREQEEAAPEEEEESPGERKLRLQLAALKAKRKPAAPVEEEENEADVSEEEPAEEEPAEEEEEAPAPRKGSKLKKKKAGAKRSLAEIFDETKPGRGLFPTGDFKAIVTGYELEGEIAGEGEDQGLLKVKVTYEGHADEEEVAGKKISQWYQIADDDGEPGPGIPFLKGDLDILGYEDVLLADLEEIFADVEAEQPEVVIKVKQNGQYTNAYLQGLAESE